MISDPAFYAVAIPTVCLVGLAKGGFLSGMGILGVPLLALLISPVQAAAIMLPILIAMDVVSVWAYRQDYDRANLRYLIPGSVIGIAVGWLTASYVSEAHVRLLVGLIAVAFTLYFWLGIRPARKAPGPHLAKGCIGGAIGGFTSFVSHAGSPPVAMYLLPQNLAPKLYAGTHALLFAAINLIKVPPYFMLGQFSAENLKTSLALMPIAPLATWVSVWLVRSVPQGPFYRIAYACLFFVGLKLIWDGGRRILGL
ncbi:MAG: sulfite exporter TauE/SafE family protein [Hyphomicrobiaceae bacterium]|nr:MAG: sulfite exporter TauE/SafE family protein [Hyphomicrobiaceae bacterium]